MKAKKSHASEGVDSEFNKVYLADARDMRELQPESVDLIVTSPPYFNIKDYSMDGFQATRHSKRKSMQIGDISSFTEFIEQLLVVWRECTRVLKPNGKLIINTPLLPMIKSDFSTHENRHIFDLNAEIQHSILSSIPGMYLMDTYIWNRTNPSKKLMFGSYPNPTNFYAQNTVEFITVYVKAGKSRTVSAEVKAKSKLTQSEWVEYTKQVWNLPVPNKSDLAFGTHTAIMPREIVERCVRLYSFYGDVVLDPFAGSGTTLKVAHELGRKFVGYEIVEAYRDIIEMKIGIDVCQKRSKTKSATLRSKQEEPKQVPQRLQNRIEHCDAIDYLAKLPNDVVQLICVDPPYNMNKAYWDSFPSESQFLEFTKRWINESVRVLCPGGALFIFNTPENSAAILLHCKQIGLDLRNWITWDKRDGFASTKSRFVPAQESILYLVKPGKDPLFKADEVRQPYDSQSRITAAQKAGIIKNGKRWYPNPLGKLSTDVWHVPSERHTKKKNGRVQKLDHPTQKPESIIERIILATTNIEDVVLDMFAGSGTTAAVAIRLGRRFIGCDGDEEYAQIANKRIQSLK